MENNKTIGVPMNEKKDTAPNKKVGVVSNCRSLRVRKTPNKNSDVLTYISEGTKVEIDDTKTSEEFYKIRVSDDVVGYCMRNFITIQ